MQCAPAQQAILHNNTSQLLRNTNGLNFISPFYSIPYYPQTIIGDKKGEKIEKTSLKNLSVLNHESCSLETLPEFTANFEYDVKEHVFLMFFLCCNLDFYAPFIICCTNNIDS